MTLQFDGQWNTGAADDAVQALWKQGMAVTRQGLTRFGMGERSGNFNRKYTRMGWDTFWKTRNGESKNK